jgi:dTMP kinase
VLKNSDRAFFTVIDGIDGCGKTTVGQFLIRFFKERASKVILTKEPGGSSFFTPIRQLMLKNDTNIELLTETLLFFADRYEHIKKIIEPSLNAGINVVCDRFIASTYAYQCFGGGIDIKLVDLLRNYVVSIKPNLTIILDVDIHIAIERLKIKYASKALNHDETRYEKQGWNFYEKVKEGFLWYAKTFENVFVVNANRDIDTVFTDVRNCIEKYLK